MAELFFEALVFGPAAYDETAPINVLAIQE
jgi:hypothetical protein